MINKLKNKFKSEDNKRLLSNFISLATLQGANYILPLITLPYLVRVLGVEYFGLLAFATATIAYFNIITDYGFNLTATREVSIHRDDKEKLIEIFSSVMTIKVMLMFLSFFLLSILVFSFEKFAQHWEVYFLTFGIVIGQVLFPVWFFQGMEKMKYITYLNILSKSIFTISIFIFVHHKNDFLIVPLLTSIGFIVAGAWSLIIIRKDFNMIFKWQSKRVLIYYLKEGWDIFIAGIFTLVYTISIPFVLGLLTNNVSVGYYAISEKVIKSIINLYGPLNNAIFPYISKLVIKSKTNAKRFLLKLLKIISILMSLVSLFIFIFSDEIISLVSGHIIVEASTVLKILSPLPVTITIARIFSFNYLIGFGYKEMLSRVYFVTALISIPLTFILIILYGEIGAAVTVIIVELFATIYMYKIIDKNIGFKYNE